MIKISAVSATTYVAMTFLFAQVQLPLELQDFVAPIPSIGAMMYVIVSFLKWIDRNDDRWHTLLQSDRKHHFEIIKQLSDQKNEAGDN